MPEVDLFQKHGLFDQVCFVDGQNHTEERYFLVETSPIIALKGDLANGISGFVSGLGWIAIVLVLLVFGLGIFAIVEYKIHHRGGGEVLSS